MIDSKRITYFQSDVKDAVVIVGLEDVLGILGVQRSAVAKVVSSQRRRTGSKSCTSVNRTDSPPSCAIIGEMAEVGVDRVDHLVDIRVSIGKPVVVGNRQRDGVVAGLSKRVRRVFLGTGRAVAKIPGPGDNLPVSVARPIDEARGGADRVERVNQEVVKRITAKVVEPSAVPAGHIVACTGAK